MADQEVEQHGVMADFDKPEGRRFVGQNDLMSAVLKGIEGGPDYMRAAVHAVGDAVIITGADCGPPGPIIEYVNPSFTRMTGYGAEEVVGRCPRFLQGPGTDRKTLDQLREALVEARPFHGEAINYRKDGTEYAVEWFITPVTDQDGKVARWIAVQRDVSELRQVLARQNRLLEEVNHRVNNTLAAVQSMALQTFHSAPYSDDTRAAFLGRLFALSRVHDRLARGHWAGASLQEVAEGQLAQRRGGDAWRIEVSGPELLLRPGAAVAIGLALHELAANAVAHGALSAPRGRVSLEWSVRPTEAGGRLLLRWSESGGPAVPGPPVRRGFGARLIERGLARELRAEAVLQFEPSGLRCEIEMPLDAVVAPAAS